MLVYSSREFERIAYRLDNFKTTQAKIQTKCDSSIQSDKQAKGNYTRHIYLSPFNLFNISFTGYCTGFASFQETRVEKREKRKG
jgi:hypothetical protein